ncbi:DUF2269 family protein [Streptomonospora sp. S1-112]|uniref:DUF2269 family protein n=1 Tax=Streptomonospora mangrovi TaxID=2883123 RepID=A0A9X3NGJ3_9ACTN|nr:DUF2269 family protein [Streptomonospora mangrovi]MDA0563299.1 DUF2269 family protein [Streptomonospora mangrovi]
MNDFLLSVHVLAAILAVGPVAVAASMFPPYVRAAGAEEDTGPRLTAMRLLARICRVYAVLGALVPMFGFATAISMGVLGDPWLMVSIGLTALAAAVLVALVLPGQERALAALSAGGAAAAGFDARRARARLAMWTGVFNLLWAVVTVLMIVRPGASHGA